MHEALKHFGGFELDVRWELMQKEAFGEEKFRQMMAVKEEEKAVKQQRLKELKELQEKQGLKTR